MAGIQLSGLASGLDWSSLVDQLMQAAAVPQTNIKTQQATVNQQASALGDLKTLLSALQTSQEALQSDGVFSARAATAADSTSTWSATAANGAATGTYQISVSKLATAASLSGATGQAASLSSTSDVSGAVISSLRLATSITAGNFTINGAQVSVATTDTLGDVFNKISTATGGVVTASYDPTSDSVSLSSSSGTLALGSAGDTSNFLQALKLYQNGTAAVSSTSTLGALRLNVPISQSGLKTAISAVDGSGNGSLTVNGVSIAYNVNTDTIQDVLNRISNSSAGVTATCQSGLNQFTLKNATTGDVGLFTSEDPGGLLAALGLGAGATQNAGTNAEYSVNGGPTQISRSNTLDEGALGIPGLSVTATTASTQTFTVSQQLSDVKSKIDDFVTKFNAVESYIADKTKVTVNGTKVTTGLLYGNSEVRALGTQLRAMIFQPTAGATGSLTRLADLGLDFAGTTNTLSVKDPTALTNALASTHVADLFASNSTSSMGQIGALLDRTIGFNGSLSQNITRLNTKSQNYDTQIANMQRQLDAQKTALTNEFVQMESAQSTLQQQSKSLASTLGSTTSS